MEWLETLQAQSRRLGRWLTSRKVRDRIQDILEAQPVLQNVPYLVAAMVVGYVAVVYAEAFHYVEVSARGIFFENPYFMFCFAPVCFLGAWALVYFLSPAAGGSGIPAVMAGINLDVKAPRRYLGRLMSLRICFVKVASSLLCVLGGGAIGREGPTIQISTSIFLAIGNQFRKVWPKSTHQPWLIAGGAAGLAAAFNTPLGGIVFAIEELAAQQFNRVKTVLIAAVIIAGLVALWIRGSYLFIGYPQLGEMTAGFIPWVILLGIVCGVLGAFFGKLLFVMRNRIRVLSATRQALVAVGAGLFIASYAYFVTDQVMGGGPEVIKGVLFSSQGSAADWGLVAGRYFGTVVSYISGVAGGIFAPSLAAGATIGSLFADLISSEHANVLVLLGMAGFLSAVTRAPFTALVLVNEMTDSHAAIFQLMLAALIGHVVSISIDSKSFYERRREELIQEIRDLEDAKKSESK